MYSVLDTYMWCMVELWWLKSIAQLSFCCLLQNGLASGYVQCPIFPINVLSTTFLWLKYYLERKKVFDIIHSCSWKFEKGSVSSISDLLTQKTFFWLLDTFKMYLRICIIEQAFYVSEKLAMITGIFRSRSSSGSNWIWCVSEHKFKPLCSRANMDEMQAHKNICRECIILEKIMHSRGSYNSHK